MDFTKKSEMMALHSNIANFIKSHDLELNEKELKAFIMVRGVLVDYWTHMEKEKDSNDKPDIDLYDPVMSNDLYDY